MNRFILYAVCILFLAMGWYSVYEGVYVSHHVAPGQEWVGVGVMTIYTLLAVGLVAKFEERS